MLKFFNLMNMDLDYTGWQCFSNWGFCAAEIYLSMGFWVGIWFIHNYIVPSMQFLTQTSTILNIDRSWVILRYLFKIFVISFVFLIMFAFILAELDNLQLNHIVMWYFLNFLYGYALWHFYVVTPTSLEVLVDFKEVLGTIVWMRWALRIFLLLNYFFLCMFFQYSVAPTMDLIFENYFSSFSVYLNDLDTTYVMLASNGRNSHPLSLWLQFLLDLHYFISNSKMYIFEFLHHWGIYKYRFYIGNIAYMSESPFELDVFFSDFVMKSTYSTLHNFGLFDWFSYFCFRDEAVAHKPWWPDYVWFLPKGTSFLNVNSCNFLFNFLWTMYMQFTFYPGFSLGCGCLDGLPNNLKYVQPTFTFNNTFENELYLWYDFLCLRMGMFFINLWTFSDFADDFFFFKLFNLYLKTHVSYPTELAWAIPEVFSVLDFNGMNMDKMSFTFNESCSEDDFGKNMVSLHMFSMYVSDVALPIEGVTLSYSSLPPSKTNTDFYVSPYAATTILWNGLQDDLLGEFAMARDVRMVQLWLYNPTDPVHSVVSSCDGDFDLDFPGNWFVYWYASFLKPFDQTALYSHLMPADFQTWTLSYLKDLGGSYNPRPWHMADNFYLQPKDMKYMKYAWSDWRSS